MTSLTINCPILTCKKAVDYEGEDFTPKDKEQNLQDRTVGDTPRRGSVPPSNILRQKRKIKIIRELSSSQLSEQIGTTSDTAKLEGKGIKFDAGSPSGITAKLTKKQSVKLKTLSTKAVKAEEKYLVQEKKHPKRHKLKITEKQPDGKRKVQLHFEEQTKVPKEKFNLVESPKTVLKQGISLVGTTAFTGVVDGSDEQSDHEKTLRIGVEKTVVAVVDVTKDIVLAPANFLDWRNQKKHGKLEKAKNKAVKAHTKSEYQKSVLKGLCNINQAHLIVPSYPQIQYQELCKSGDL